jgi:hypothetical protein
MDITCLDLSPFYLEKSRDNMDYWRRMRAPPSQKISTDKFIQVSNQTSNWLRHWQAIIFTCTFALHELSSFHPRPCKNMPQNTLPLQAAAEDMPVKDNTYDVVRSNGLSASLIEQCPYAVCIISCASRYAHHSWRHLRR